MKGNYLKQNPIVKMNKDTFLNCVNKFNLIVYEFIPNLSGYD